VVDVAVAVVTVAVAALAKRIMIMQSIKLILQQMIPVPAATRNKE